MLDQELINQLVQYLALLEADLVITASLDESENAIKTRNFLNEIIALTPRITLKETKLKRTPSFTIDRVDYVSGITFAGIPLGHEFTSFVLALLQVSGRPPKIDESLVKQIKQINQPLSLETYVSLSCHNCPDVVQALNIMSVLNPLIEHTMIEGSMYKDEVETVGIMAVPTIMLDGEEFGAGRLTLEKILDKINGQTSQRIEKDLFDVLVVGGGPSGASAAIYAARKGIRTGLVTESFGGQPLETLSIENIIGTQYVEGPKLMAQIEDHVLSYPVDLITSQRAVKLEKKDVIEVTFESGSVLKAKSVVLSTGARWRNLNIPGEQEFKNKGVAYCPHCDGPLFAGKDLVVVGGGNSGIEAAIDLAGIASHVTVLEFMPDLKADQVLQDRLYSLSNVTVLKNVETKEIKGSTKVEQVTYMNRETNELTTINVQGIFILIGLQPNTEWLGTEFEKTRIGELVTNKQGQTSVPGVFAAGDCTDSAYKQIIISMGSGATAALGAFDYLIRNT